MLGNTWGRLFRVTTCGESYGEALQIIVEGVPSGIPLSKEEIQAELDRRRPGTSPLDSPRQETDQVEIVAGLMDGVTTGAPIGMIIYNVDRQPIHVQQYRQVKDLIRPGHAEYTYFMKYGRYADWRGAGRASGRETAGRVAAGAIARKLLARENIYIWGYVKECAGIAAREMSLEEIKAHYRSNLIHCPDEEAAQKMIARILEIKEEGDTCGGIVEVIAEGVPPGLGEPVFHKLSADLAAALMSIGSVKGVEFGLGFQATRLKGSENNDIPYLDGNRVRFRTNHAGGLLGGISTGENIVARIAVKPTSTISKDQQTVNMAEMKEEVLAAITRRDPTICARIVSVAEAMVALTLMDHLMIWRGWQGIARHTRQDNPWLAAWEEEEV